jgi:peptide/nickel transport system ATP-binding protein
LGARPGPGGARGRLAEIPGSVPRLAGSLDACVYAPRCAFATPECGAAAPPTRDLGPGHASACIHAEAVIAAMTTQPLARQWA